MDYSSLFNKEYTILLSYKVRIFSLFVNIQNMHKTFVSHKQDGEACSFYDLIAICFDK